MGVEAQISPSSTAFGPVTLSGRIGDTREAGVEVLPLRDQAARAAADDASAR